MLKTRIAIIFLCCNAILLLLADNLIFPQTSQAASQMCKKVKNTFINNFPMCNRLNHIHYNNMNQQQKSFYSWCLNQLGFLYICNKEATLNQHGDVYAGNNQVEWIFRREQGQDGNQLFIIAKQNPNGGINVIVATPVNSYPVTVPYCNYSAYKYSFAETVYYANNTKQEIASGVLFLAQNAHNASGTFKGLFQYHVRNGIPIRPPYGHRNCENLGKHVNFQPAPQGSRTTIIGRLYTISNYAYGAGTVCLTPEEAAARKENGDNLSEPGDFCTK